MVICEIFSVKYGRKFLKQTYYSQVEKFSSHFSDKTKGLNHCRLTEYINNHYTRSYISMRKLVENF